MADVSVLDVALYGERIGTLTLLPGDLTLFALEENYINDPNRPTLSLSFKDAFGELIIDSKPRRVRVPSFFSNLLPEGALRDYLAKKTGANPEREFFLLWMLGRDLPGAITIAQADGEAWPPQESLENPSPLDARETLLRFSLAGVQLKFSAAWSLMCLSVMPICT